MDDRGEKRPDEWARAAAATCATKEEGAPLSERCRVKNIKKKKKQHESQRKIEEKRVPPPVALRRAIAGAATSAAGPSLGESRKMDDRPAPVHLYVSLTCAARERHRGRLAGCTGVFFRGRAKLNGTRAPAAARVRRRSFEWTPQRT